MNLFSKMFGGSDSPKKPEKLIPWKPLTRVEQLSDIQELSKTKTVGIFKHSTRCGISSMTLRRFEEQLDTSVEGVELYYLDLISFREVSNEIVGAFGVMHQSPQLLIIKNGQAVHAASHYEIQAQRLTDMA